MATRCYIAPADDAYGHAGQEWCTDDGGNYWPRRPSLDPPVGGTPAPPTTPPTPPGPANPNPVVPPGGVDSGAAQLALAAWVAAQQAKAAADRLNLLDIPNAAKADANEKARIAVAQATEARAGLNDEQRRRLDEQTATLDVSKVTGYVATPGLSAGVGQRILDSANALRNDANYKAVAARAAAGDAAALAQKKQMEAGSVANATGLPMHRAGALYEQLGSRYQATGQIPGAGDIDRLIQNDPSYQTTTLDRERYQTDAALRYQEMLASKAGRPEDAFTYAATIRDTPQSIRDLINKAAGQANLPGLRYPGAGGAAPQQGGQMMTQGGVATQAGGMPGGGAPGGAGGANPGGDQTDSAPGFNTGVSRPQPTGLGASNQIAPQDYQRANPYLQKMVWAGYGANGKDPDAEKANYLKSLPQYRQSQVGRYAA